MVGNCGGEIINKFDIFLYSLKYLYYKVNIVMVNGREYLYFGFLVPSML